MSTNPETFQDDTSSTGDALFPLRPHLFVVLECDRPTAGGARHALLGVEEVVIGRGEERSAVRETSGGAPRLFVSLPGKSLSSTHARLTKEGAAWVLMDVRSKNGSFVNGKRIERAIVSDGDVIEVGHTMLCLRSALSTPAGTALDLDIPGDSGGMPGIVTLIPALAHQLAKLLKIAEAKLPIVLVGETGTGKEVVARTIHAVSRRPGPFVAVNCGALPANLQESQLFGHVKGSFSGAVRDEIGFVRSADRGTLLLDEVGDLPATAQAALLRALQEGEVVPVGSARPTRVDIRIVAASHEPLDVLVASGRFRSDLVGRLEGFEQELPSLAGRREDLGLIIASLFRKLVSGDQNVVSLKPSVGRALCSYEWPLNIRELEQCLMHALTLAGASPVERSHLPAKVAASVDGASARSRPARTSETPALPWKDDATLRRVLIEKLEEHGGNVAQVALAMGRARMQVHRWMNKFGIDPDVFRKGRKE
jgi:DNA-binding NtrC family response regulator